jgi:SOS-response transcriptional repressor LexA
MSGGATVGQAVERQQRMLLFIRDYTTERGRPPTIREIADECGITSTSIARYHLCRLAAADLVDC